MELRELTYKSPKSRQKIWSISAKKLSLQKINLSFMATIELSLSKKATKITNEAGQVKMLYEVMIRFFHGHINLHAKSEVFVSKDFFEYYIDKKLCDKIGIRVPAKMETATEAEALKRGLQMRNVGDIVIRKRVITQDVVYHREQQKRINGIKEAIVEAFEKADKHNIKIDWLKGIVEKYNHPSETEKRNCTDFFDTMQNYLEAKHFSVMMERHYKVLARSVGRYVAFVRATNKKRRHFSFDVEKLTKDDIEDYRDYLRNESDLAAEQPALFARIVDKYPDYFKSNRFEIHPRGENTIFKFMKELKAFFNWLNKTERTSNRPFEKIELGSEQYGAVNYITIKERNQIAECDLSQSKHLETQRDIFVFQCFVGCRVGDLMRFTEANIEDGVLTYVPHKTKDEGGQSVVARIPLHPKAIELVEKYRGKDPKGRLFPFISPQKYNYAIKEVFTKAEVTRNVIVRNALTGENEARPINEIASSHMARKTFIGNAYLISPDQAIIASMSGHTQNSRAFARYRNIEDSTKKAIIDKL